MGSINPNEKADRTFLSRPLLERAAATKLSTPLKSAFRYFQLEVCAFPISRAHIIRWNDLSRRQRPRRTRTLRPCAAATTAEIARSTAIVAKTGRFRRPHTYARPNNTTRSGGDLQLYLRAHVRPFQSSMARRGGSGEDRLYCGVGPTSTIGKHMHTLVRVNTVGCVLGSGTRGKTGYASLSIDIRTNLIFSHATAGRVPVISTLSPVDHLSR